MERIVEVKNFDYVNKYEYVTKSVASINKYGCFAVCVHCDILESLDKKTKKTELKIYRDSTAEFVKVIDINTSRYECSAISFNGKDLVLLCEDYLNEYAKQILHLYDLKQLDTAKLQVETEYLNKTIRSFMNEENIYFINEKQPFIHVYNLNLEHLNSVGSLNYPNQYYIESNKIFINNGFIFCQNANNVEI
jgi:hypothetical protein